MTDQNQIDTLVSNIVNCRETQDLLHAYGLNAHRITWEDTARTKGSCWGPNISDMTLTVKSDRGREKLMPVIRKPNFSDITCDIKMDQFKLRVGNESENASHKIVSLKDYITDLGLYNAERDDVVLTSSQCCVLPVEKGKKTEFAVQLFNYQSYNDDPAVLVILASKDGTSTQIVERSNQKLFFNDKGIARWFNVERLEDVRERRKEEKTRVDSYKEMTKEEKLDNTIMMIQIPLVVKEKHRREMYQCMMLNSCGGAGDWEDSYSTKGTLFTTRSCSRRVKGRGMDMGQIGLGSEEGKFIGTKGLKLERDTRFPVRCTYQYYRVTDENYITEKNVIDISSQLADAANVSVAQGSLVIGDKTDRITEPDLNKPKPQDSPYGKLNERDYLKYATVEYFIPKPEPKVSLPTPVEEEDVWTKNVGMAPF